MITIQAIRPKQQNASPDYERDLHIKEWEKARDTLQFYDDKLHDLRKYGFSFITVLLTADGILLSSDESGSYPVTIKFAVFGVTLILILALHLIDKNYRVFQRAAATRALVLEKELNVELSEIITERYREEHINLAVLIVYVFFTLGVLILGGFTIGVNIYLAVLVLIALGVTILILRLNLVYKYKLPQDWTISPLECSKQGKIKITLNNLGALVDYKPGKDVPNKNQQKGIKLPDPIIINKGDLLWEIISEESGEVYKSKKADINYVIYDSQSWILTGDEFEKTGIYRLRPNDYPLPLHRRIIISGTTRNKDAR